MADTTITGLPNASALTGTERVPMDQAGTTVDAAASAIAALATAATVGLGSCNNTADLAKPISTATQTALDLKANTNDARLTDSREWSAATASQAEAEAGSSTTRLAFTPQRVFQAIAAWWAASAAKTKLDGIAAGATANSSDATLLARSAHTGTQAVGTITGLGSLATQSGTFSGTSSGTNTGDQTITLTGDVTGSGTGSFTATVANSAVIGKALTGFTSGAGTVAATDTILQAIQKLDGNDRTVPTQTLTYAATINLDLAALTGTHQLLTLTGAVEFTTSNRALGYWVTIFIDPGASNRTLTFPAGWTFYSAKPATQTANKRAVLTLKTNGTGLSDIHAAWKEAP
jgi:hypothetical protein